MMQNESDNLWGILLRNIFHLTSTLQLRNDSQCRHCFCVDVNLMPLGAILFANVYFAHYVIIYGIEETV